MPKTKSKTVVVLKTEHSSCFEEAHLILKDKFDWNDPSQSMVEEANRIVLQAETGQTALPVPFPCDPDHTKLRWFLAGMFTALGICMLSAFLLSLLI